MKDGIVRAGREAGRVRVIGEAQARLVALRLTRRSKRDALADEVLALYRRGALRHPALDPLCIELESVQDDIERLEDVLARARGATPEPRPSSPVVTEITHPRQQDR